MDLSELIKLCKEINIKYEINGKTASLTSIRVGNEAKLIVYPNNTNDLCDLLAYVNKNNIKYFVLGNGTNVYFCDFYSGVIIVTSKINNIEIKNDELIAQCGADILKCARMSLYHSLSGLEFAYGIPATIGGALYMNAEAFGSRFSDIVSKTIVYDTYKREVIELKNSVLAFSSKSSIFSSSKRYILLEATLKLKAGNFEQIQKTMLQNMKKRIDTQPLNMPSAGSAFKRTNDIIPSKLIDQIGLKGYRIGDAEISKKHAGFIVNLGSATAQNINDLISYIKAKIYKEYSVNLEEEILYIE